jgi:diguanylate cyclase (GGDEF)-like protein
VNDIVADHSRRDWQYPRCVDRQRCLSAILESFETVVGVDACLLLRPEGSGLVVEATSGWDGAPEPGSRWGLPPAADQGCCQSLAPPWPSDGIDAWSWVPIEVDAHRVEWAALGRRSWKPFSERERLEIQAIARLAGHVFGSEAVQADMEAQLTRFSILIKIGQALSANLDLEVLLEKVYQEVSSFFDTTSFYIALSRPESGEFVMGLAYEHGRRESGHATYPIGNGLTGHIIRTAKPLFLPVWANQEAFLQGEGIQVIGEPPKSWMGVPLIAGEAVVGVMAIQNYDVEGAYTRGDLDLFSAIASQIAMAVWNAQLFEEAERRARETSVLAAIGRDISSSLDLETVLERIAHGVRELLTRGSAAIFLFDEQTAKLSAVAVSGKMERLRESLVAELGKGMLGSIVANRKSEIVNNVVADARAVHVAGSDEEREGDKFMAAPLFSRDLVIGAVAVWRGPGEPTFKAEELEFLEGLGQQASIAIRNAQLYRQTKHLATTDGLTGLLNRRCVAERIDEEFTKSRRYRRPTSIIMVDVDHFKRVNDEHGHEAGDLVLRALAEILVQSVRQSDAVGRYGGEEFVALLPETTLEGAAALAERIRIAVAETEIPLPSGRRLSVTASFGVSSMDGTDANYEAVLKRADQAMYRSKQAGRNRVASEPAALS